MQKYKYLNCNLGPKDLTGLQNDQIQSTLTQKGLEGWELVSVYDRQQLSVGQSRTVYLYGIFKQIIQ